MDGPRIHDLVERHESYRNEGINLVVSENWLSPAVREALSNDLAGRYHTEWYSGSRYAREIIQRTEELACELFRCRHAMVEPLSGNVCDLTVLFTFTRVHEPVAITPFTSGGYPLGLERFERRRVDLVADPDTLRFDLEGCRKAVLEEKPRLTVMGSSFIPFAHPVKEVSSYVREMDSGEEGDHLTVYDGAHVLGLIATGAFQDPLREGAEVLFGSTHKTFYGPQGGIILTDSDEHASRMRSMLDIDFSTGLGLVDNVHMNRVASLGVALEEMLDDPWYGNSVASNSRALARALVDGGIPVRYGDRGYSDSHQVRLDMTLEESTELCHRLESAGIFIDIGGRVGTQEVTHRGYGTTDMEEVAGLIVDVWKGMDVSGVKERSKRMALDHST